jgi:xylulokinase
MGHGIGIDVGTTNVKVALVEASGAIVTSASRPLTSLRVDGTAEQDAGALWDAVVDAVREATAGAPAAGLDVDAICVCSQYSSIVPVDADGRPVAPMTLYWDHRGTARSWEVMERHPEALATFLEHHGIPPIGSGLSLGHILSFQHDDPDVHARTAAYLEPMDYVNARLTGRIAATQCTMFMSQLCDNRTVGTTEYDPELVRLSGVDASRLPHLVPVDGVVGEIRADVAAQLGVARGATVHAGMNDSHAGAFAAGVFAPGRGGLAIGTTAVLLDTVDDKRADLDVELVSMPSPVPGRYLAWAENGIAGKAVEHVLEHVVFAADELADHFSDDFFAALDDGIAASPPGSRGVLFLPWLAGSMAPAANARMRGAFLNLSLETRRTDLVRAMVEGTALNVAWLLPAVERFTGQAIEELAFFGGAARSKGWAQILADVLDRPVVALRDPDRSVARAMGLLALERSGIVDAGAAAHVDAGATYDPRAGLRRVYDAAGEQFVAAFGALRPIYEALASAAEETQEGATP